MSRPWSTRISVSRFGMSEDRTRSDLCGDITSRTHRVREREEGRGGEGRGGRESE